MKTFLEAGKIINKRGLSGELKVDSYCDTPQAFCSFERFFLDGKGENEIKVISSKVYNGYVYLKLEGINSASDAEKYKNRILYINRNDMQLDEDRYFIDDIIGLDVINADDGTVYGKLTEVFNRGASDIYTVKNGDKEYLIPAVSEIVIKIDVNKGIFIRPIPGLIDNAEEIH